MCAVGMPAQVGKFGENKLFTNRNVCFGGTGILPTSLPFKTTTVNVGKYSTIHGPYGYLNLVHQQFQECTIRLEDFQWTT